MVVLQTFVIYILDIQLLFFNVGENEKKTGVICKIARMLIYFLCSSSIK